MGRPAKYGEAMSGAERIREFRERQRLGLGPHMLHLRVLDMGRAYAKAVHEFATALAREEDPTAWVDSPSENVIGILKALASNPERAREAAHNLTQYFDTAVEEMLWIGFEEGYDPKDKKAWEKFAQERGDAIGDRLLGIAMRHPEPEEDGIVTEDVTEGENIVTHPVTKEEPPELAHLRAEIWDRLGRFAGKKDDPLIPEIGDLLHEARSHVYAQALPKPTDKRRLPKWKREREEMWDKWCGSLERLPSGKGVIMNAKRADIFIRDRATV